MPTSIKTDLELLYDILTDGDREQLKLIYEPKVVAIQPEDTRRDLCVMPDGELRFYGHTARSSPSTGSSAVYLSSRDCGLSWKMYYDDPKAVMHSAMRNPYTGEYLTIISGSDGTYALKSNVGPGDSSPRKIKITDKIYGDFFQPIALKSRRRLVCTAHYDSGDEYNPAVFVSDDDGDSWKVVDLVSAPKFEVVWPHRGLRWENNGSEPNLCELPDGRLMLVARTSLDYLYVYYSSDGGDSFTCGEPSDFHCTLTTPFFLPLSDGRTVFFWNNTQPLAEVDHTLVEPYDHNVVIGAGEDAFTNRDACHAAISDDCIHWRGYRELYLCDIRNEPDYRTNGGPESSADKSIHQFQAIELPYGKILAAFGQHEAARRLVIFDVNWLYETSRSEDFRSGLRALSTQMYVKSYSGCWLGRGLPGHCAWNRTNGALLMPSPDETYGEALQICRIHDERLVSELQGAVWNFPAATRGQVMLDMLVLGDGLKLSLCDHWINPCDQYVTDYSHFTFTLTRDMFTTGSREQLQIEFDTELGYAIVTLSKRKLFRVAMKPLKLCGGISYLHMQTASEREDFLGSYIFKLHMETL